MIPRYAAAPVRPVCLQQEAATKYLHSSPLLVDMIRDLKKWSPSGTRDRKGIRQDAAVRPFVLA